MALHITCQSQWSNWLHLCNIDYEAHLSLLTDYFLSIFFRAIFDISITFRRQVVLDHKVSVQLGK